MTFLEYQKEAIKTRVGSADNEEYLTLGLIAEVGEVADKLAKRRRDGVWDEKAFVKELGDVLWFVANLADYWDKMCDDSVSTKIDGRTTTKFYNRGDVCWRVKALARWTSAVVCGISDGEECFPEIISILENLAEENGYTLEQVAEINIAKLRDRQARGVIQGNGDER